MPVATEVTIDICGLRGVVVSRNLSGSRAQCACEAYWAKLVGYSLDGHFTGFTTR